MLVPLLVVEFVAVAFLFWKRRLMHGWNTSDAANFNSSPDAHYIYSTVLRAEAVSLGFVLGFWAASLIVMSIAFRLASGQAKSVEKALGCLIAALPLLAIATSL